MSRRTNIRRVCLVAGRPELEQGFRELGCEVRVFHPAEGGVLDLAEALDGTGFVPDLILQREQLSGPNVLTGLDAFDCPRVFWSLDTHLGLWWQKQYAALFDGVLTTQNHLVDEFAFLKKQGVRIACLPWAGFEREWTPFSRRSIDIGFVGRVTRDRPIRARLVELLRTRWGASCVDGLSFAEMCGRYADTRIAPNESIFGEINFRLFETASCGCLPVIQDIGHPVDHLFIPGREAEVYADAAELTDILDRCLSNPEHAEQLGRAAWERVQREHLFVHRAGRILDFAAGLDRAGLAGAEADKARLTARHALWLGGRVPFPPGALERELLALGGDPDAAAPLLELYAAVGQTDKAERLVSGFVSGNVSGDAAGFWSGPAGKDMVMPAAAVSMTGLRFGNFALAVKAYLDAAAGVHGPVAPPSSPVELLKGWARLLRSLGRVLRPGFHFDPSRHLPATAAECLAAALEHDPSDLETHRLLDSCLAGVRGAEHLRVGFLSHLSLHDPDNWRLGLNLGLLNLKVFRVREGAEEIRAALDAAARAGKSASCGRMLAAADPQGAVRKLVAGNGGPA